MQKGSLAADAASTINSTGSAARLLVSDWELHHLSKASELFDPDGKPVSDVSTTFCIGGRIKINASFLAKVCVFASVSKTSKSLSKRQHHPLFFRMREAEMKMNCRLCGGCTVGFRSFC